MMMPELVAAQVEEGIDRRGLIPLGAHRLEVFAEEFQKFRRIGDFVLLDRALLEEVEQRQEHDRFVRPLMVADTPDIEPGKLVCVNVQGH